jgi:hypothetical protein
VVKKLSDMTAEERAYCLKAVKIYDDAIDLGYRPAEARQRMREKLAEDEREDVRHVTE